MHYELTINISQRLLTFVSDNKNVHVCLHCIN